jgi:hypothetical protein
MHEGILLPMLPPKIDNITLFNFCQFGSYKVICHLICISLTTGKAEILFMAIILLIFWIHSSLNSLADFLVLCYGLGFKCPQRPIC